MKRVFVTGASGFLGTHLVKALRARGDQVCCLVRKTSRREHLAAMGVTFAEGDVTDHESLLAPCADADIVFHVAAFLKAPWMEAFQRINVYGTESVARACAGAEAPPTLVVVSSLAAAGPCHNDEPIDEGREAQPVSIYGKAKLSAEMCAVAFSRTVPTSIVRPPGVFGEGDIALTQLFGALRKGWHVAPGSGAQKMSMIHVEDLVQAMLLVGDAGERLPLGDEPDSPGQGIYFLADPEPITFVALGQTLAAAFGRTKVRVIRVPGFVLRVVASISELIARIRNRPVTLNRDKAREALAGDWVCSVAKAQDQLGFAPAFSLKERLSQTAQLTLPTGAKPSV